MSYRDYPLCCVVDLVGILLVVAHVKIVFVANLLKIMVEIISFIFSFKLLVFR